MANKLLLVSATLTFFFLLANASIYRTVVEFNDEEDTGRHTGPFGPQQKQQCRKEFKEDQHLQACQNWLRKKAMQAGSGPSLQAGGGPSMFELDDMEREQGSQQMPQMLEECCNELRQEEPVCVCPTLKQASKAVKIQGQHGSEETRQIYYTAKNLPEICNIRQVGVCPFKAGRPLFPPSY
ncbi:unnamed protein product [Cochlearia groenlandica]